MGARNAGYAGRGVVPPLLSQQERLAGEAERPDLPGPIVEAVILGQRIDARRRVALKHGAPGRELREPHLLSQKLDEERRLFAR